MDGEQEGGAYGWSDGQKLALPYSSSRDFYILHSTSLCINCITHFLLFFTPVRLAITCTHRNLSFDDVAVCMDVFSQSYMLGPQHVFSTTFKLCMYETRIKAMGYDDINERHFTMA